MLLLGVLVFLGGFVSSFFANTRKCKMLTDGKLNVPSDGSLSA